MTSLRIVIALWPHFPRDDRGDLGAEDHSTLDQSIGNRQHIPGNQPARPWRSTRRFSNYPAISYLFCTSTPKKTGVACQKSPKTPRKPVQKALGARWAV
jgi:hypothetical protein